MRNFLQKDVYIFGENAVISKEEVDAVVKLNRATGGLNNTTSLYWICIKRAFMALASTKASNPEYIKERSEQIQKILGEIYFKDGKNPNVENLVQGFFTHLMAGSFKKGLDIKA